MHSMKHYRPTTRVRCIKLSFNTMPERDCWKKLLEDEGFSVTKANTKEVCYEDDEDRYDSDEIKEIDCECSGCRLYQ